MRRLVVIAALCLFAVPAAPSQGATATTKPKIKPTSGPVSVVVTSTGSGIVAMVHGSGGQISATYSTDPDPTACSESCLTFAIGAGDGGKLTLDPGPCKVTLAPGGELVETGAISCGLSVLGGSFTMASDGVGNRMTLPEAADCAPVQAFIKGGIGVDAITAEGGCYVSISCGDALDENGNGGGFDSVDALRSSINPAIAGDCELVNGKFVAPIGGTKKATTTKKTTTKKKR